MRRRRRGADVADGVAAGARRLNESCLVSGTAILRGAAVLSNYFLKHDCCVNLYVLFL